MRQRVKKLMLNRVDLHIEEFNKFGRFGQQKCSWIRFDEYSYTTKDDHGSSIEDSLYDWSDWTTDHYHNGGAQMEKI